MRLPEPIRVHVLSTDRRVQDAAKALPATYSVGFSTDKWEALREIETRADIAVIELDLGGFGVTRDIRERTTDRHVRVVMLCSRPHDRWLCKQAGADEVLIKPLSDTSVLIKAVTG
jgi:DNA-binding response OmpR family regulator